MNNPIIQRELIGMLRTRRALSLQVALVTALGALVLLRWPSDAQVDISGMQAQQVLRIFGYGLMVALILLAPVFPATSIVKEKQKGTLALLLNSPMSAWSIMAGKLLGSLGYILVLLGLSVPAAAACFAMGGIGLGQLGNMYLILALLSVMYMTLALLISSYASSTDSALRTTYGLILALAVVTLGPYQFFHGSAFATGAVGTAIEWLRAVSPIPAMMEAMQDTGFVEGLGDGRAAYRFAAIAIVSSVVFTVWTTARLNQRIFDRARDQGKVTDEQSTGVRIFRRIMFLWFFDPNRRTGMIGPLANPVMVKEQRSRKFGRGHWMMRLLGACLVVSLGLVLLTTFQTEQMDLGTLGGIMVLLQASLIVLLTPSLASGVISTEIESGGWQLLQMTPMSAVTIVLGKLMSGFVPLLLILLATLPAYLVLIAIDSGYQTIAIQVLFTLFLTAVLALLVSAAVSSLCTRTATATGVAYTILVSLFAGTMLFWMAQDAPFARSTVEAILTINPLAAALNIIEAPGFSRYQLVPANWWITVGMCLICLAILSVRTWQLTRPR